MKLESTLDRRPAMLHLVPVLDAMALLLIFFLIGTTSFIHQSGVAVNLPESRSQVPQLTASHAILITDGEDPRVFFDRKQLGFDELLDRLRGRLEQDHDTIYLRADRRATHDTVMRIVNAAFEGGFKHLHLATQMPGAVVNPSPTDVSVGTPP